ncbi:MAG: hypothetical protein RR346_09295 [Bacteroidales bacterium]
MKKTTPFSLFSCCLLFCSASLQAKEIRIENRTLSCTQKEDVVILKSKSVRTPFEVVLNPDKEWGTARVEKIAVAGKGAGQQLVFPTANGHSVCLSLFEDIPFLYVSSLIANNTGKPVSIKEFSFSPLHVKSDINADQLVTLGTGGWSRAAKEQGSFTYSLLADPVSRHSVFVGWATQYRGLGLVRFAPVDKQTSRFDSHLEFGNLSLNADSRKASDTLVVAFFEDGRRGLETYADLLAKTYQIRLPQKPEVHCTWYYRNKERSGASNETDLTANVLFAAKELKPFGLNVIQIDDEWQTPLCKDKTEPVKLGNGPVKNFAAHNANFPSGMAHMSDVIEKNGFTSGLWFMPFSGDVHHPDFDSEMFAKNAQGEVYEIQKWSGTPIDASSPKGESFLRERFNRICNWGYTYLKIDGLHSGAPSENIYINRDYKGTPLYADARIHDPEMTFVELFRKGIGMLRAEAPGAFLLGCSATQNMSSFAPAFGLVDAMRVGPDNDSAANGRWKNVTRGADYAGNLFFLNNRVWYNDPDPYYVRTSNPLHMARWMVSWQTISGAMGTSSEQYPELPAERLDLIKRALPTHNYPALPVDILENEHPRIWKVDNERMSVIGLFNWSDKEPLNLEYDLARMDMSAKRSYEVFDFWENRYVGTMRGKLATLVDKASCKVWAVRESKSHPQVLSTSRHITQGLMDIVSEKWNGATNTLSGRSAMVANDSYELRIVVPGGLKISEATAGGKKMKVVRENNFYRVSILPDKTGECEWVVRFTK